MRRFAGKGRGPIGAGSGRWWREERRDDINMQPIHVLMAEFQSDFPTNFAPKSSTGLTSSRNESG
jgi:hypothetical protein